ncbi:MAG TPA: hypothetical protein DCZ40_12900 [Lachnospiraceae bacterium]|nr:hypothetical protein [Lachnospiraceae bacterium]
MTNFKRTRLTADGNILAAKSGINVEFTKVETGCGIYRQDEDVGILTGLKDKKQTFTINSISRKEDALVKLNFVISNRYLQESYLLTEIGIFANDPDKGEILYAVCSSIPEDSQKVLRYNGEFISNIVMSVNIKVSGESTVSFNASGVFALQEDFEELQRNQEEALSKYALGKGIELFVDNEGILNITYDDGTEEEEGQDGTDNQGS